MSSVIFLQLSNQSLVARLAAFHADPSLSLFPEGLGQQARRLCTLWMCTCASASVQPMYFALPIRLTTVAAAQATEVLTSNATGIHNRKGRHLLRLDNVTATPAEIDAWCSCSPVLRNCTRVFVFDASTPPARSLVGMGSIVA